MTDKTKKASETKLVIPCRMSYVHVWEPVGMADGSGEKKYSVSMIIPKSDTKTIDAIKAAIEKAKEAGKEKWGGKIPLNLKLPLRDGDDPVTGRPNDEAYKNSYFITASSKTQPGIVDKKVQKIIDETEVYSGIYGNVSVNFYPFKVSGSAGIACGLNHVQKTKDGEALGGRGKAEDDFQPIDDQENVDDLVG